jgi:hypothetical protein
MLAKRVGSNNSSSSNLRGTHVTAGEGRPKAFTKGLRRRDLTHAFIARFHTKYQKTPSCWLWTAGRYPRGYGMVNLGRDMRGRQYSTYAHRVAYVLAHGPIEPGQVVMHACDVTACVNPAHLRLGTQADNVRDASTKGRLAKQHPGAWVLTNEQVRAVRASVETLEVLAKRYGVSKTHISLVRRELRRKAA